MKIQLDNIIHARGYLKIPGGRIFFIVIGMLHCPFVIPASMIGHPINDHFETKFMGVSDKNPEIVKSTKLGVDRYVIRSRVITSQDSLFIFLSNGSDGHKP